MGKRQYGFAFFLSLYVQLIEYAKPDKGWPVIPEFGNAAAPAVAALFAHLTVLLIVLIGLPSETEFRTKVQIWKKRRKINKKLADNTVSEDVKKQLKAQLDQLHLTELEAYDISIEPVPASDSSASQPSLNEVVEDDK